MPRVALVTFLLLTVGLRGVGAQERGAPPGWQWRMDQPAARVSHQATPDSAWRFDQMPPGWHITTGPAGILYPSTERAAGLFSLVADFVVFPETTASEFGILLGGSNLDGDSPTYVATVLRRDGAARVIRRVRGSETVLVPWTQHSAIKSHPGAGTVTNRLRVNASADSLRVFVNDSAIMTIGLPSTETTGQFGFRVGQGVNLHLTILDLIRHLAPTRSR